MKSKLRIFVLILLSLLLISGCIGSKKDFAYSELLSGKEGKYSLLVVIDQPEGKTLVEFPEVANAELHFNEYNLIKLIKMTDLKIAQNSYTLLEISKAPSFLVFDNKGLVLKTNNEEEVGLFLANANANANVNIPTTNATLSAKPDPNTPMTIIDYKGNVIMETTNAYYYEHQEEIEKDYHLGMYSPNKKIDIAFEEKGEMTRTQIIEIGQTTAVETDLILQAMLKDGGIEKVVGKAEVYKVKEAAMDKKPAESVKGK